MGVTSAVRAAAVAVEEQFPEEPGVSVAAQVLASMPYWCEQRRLNVWERTYLDLPDEPPRSVPFVLLEAVFEFGRANLYGAFNADTSARAYKHLTSLLAAHGIEIDGTHPVDGW